MKRCKKIYLALFMPYEDENFGGSSVLDFRNWWHHVKTIYKGEALLEKARERL